MHKRKQYVSKQVLAKSLTKSASKPLPPALHKPPHYHTQFGQNLQPTTLYTEKVLSLSLKAEGLKCLAQTINNFNMQIASDVKLLKHKN